MKKYIYAALVLSTFLLHGCSKDKDDDFIRLGRGEIRHDGQVHQLYNARKWTFNMGQNDCQNVFHRSYDMRVIRLTGVDYRNIFADLTIRTEKDKFESGMFHMMIFGISNESPNSIRMHIRLNDDVVHRLKAPQPPSTKVYVSITEEEDTFEIRLYGGDFFIKYRGLVRTW